MARRKQDTALLEFGKKWIERIDAATKLEKEWLDDAHKAEAAYTGKTKDVSGARKYDFNILYANVETIVPAIINSAPAPDIRRRFGDADPVARVVAEIIERAIRTQVDDSKLQIELEAAAQDAFLAGRGIVRLRFKSDIVGGEPTDEEIEDAAEGEDASVPVDGNQGYLEDDAGGDGAENREEDQPSARGIEDNGGPPLERLENERITFEAVSWVDYRHGPAKRWDERPWDAFRFCIPREDEEKSFDRGLIASQLDDKTYNDRLGSENDVTGWEIWCKEKREVYFIDDNGVVLKRISDPLGLSNFFPIATPMQPVEVNGKLCPVNPFAVYRTLANDLDEAVRRRAVLVKAMKARGWYALSETDMKMILELEDNEFTPINSPEIWAQNGGIQNAVAFWPLEKFAASIVQIDQTIAQLKQWIYEITGISDIIRGASVAKETATAQNIKSQWGSLRIQKMQRMMERCARDLFVMMSEIIPNKFSHQTLEEMTGTAIVPTINDTPEQAQQKAQIIAMMKRPLNRFYRIDVESDSTVRADLTRQKQEVAEFLQGAAQYFAAVGPLVQEGALPADAAVEIFSANARLFNLGRSVEDTLENMVALAKQKTAQGPQPNQQEQAAAAKTQAEGQKIALEAQAKQQEMSQSAQRFQFDMQQRQAEFQAKAAEAAVKAQADGLKAQRDAILAELDAQLKQIDLQIRAVDLEIKQTELAIKQTPPAPSPALEPEAIP